MYEIYETPKMKIILFEEDVITTSGEGEIPTFDPNEGPIVID